MKGVAWCAVVGGIVALSLSAAGPGQAQAVADSTAVPDSTMPPDSTATSDSTAVTPAEPFAPSPQIRALSSLHVDWSVNALRQSFGPANDPDSPVATQTLADVLRLAPGVRTRELSQGPTAETFELRGSGTGRAPLLYSGTSLTVPGTSGPLTNELVLSEIDGITLVSGGAGALYGPEAAGGALLVEPRFPIHTDLLSRINAEEGVDGYQRGAFQASHPIGTSGAFFVNAESRRVDGFFPGTKEVDRQFTGVVAGKLGDRAEGSFQYRRWEGDARFNGFEPATIGSIVTKRGDYLAKVYRPWSGERGALVEAGLVRERLENILDGIATREIRSPSLRLTTDLPGWHGGQSVLRVETSHWRIDSEESGDVDEFWRGAVAWRYSRRLGSSFRFTESLRYDAEQDRTSAWHVRWEGAWERNAWTAHVVTSRNAFVPPRGSEGSTNEIQHSSELGVRCRGAKIVAGLTGFGSRIADLRPEPTFEQIRAREPALGAPLGDAVIGGATVDVETVPLSLPILSLLGDIRLRTSYTVQHTELDETDEPLAGRPKRIWTGGGYLQRALFQGELLARVRGRLTHYGDRVDEDGNPVIDMWFTDVILEGAIGDAVVFYRFHDLLDRADEVEPGIRFPGFSRMYGVSWKFWG